MNEKEVSDAATNTGKFFAMLKSMNEFDKAEVKGVMDTLVSPSDRDNCFVGTYYRTIANVATMLRLDQVRDCQAIVMLARALFELAVDIRLLEAIPNGWLKMFAHADLEKLRVSKKAVAFKKANPSAEVDISEYEIYIANNSARINGLCKSIWPNKQIPKHWSGLALDQRADTLKAPFDQIYAVDYARLSWYVHPGITGVLNLPPIAYIHLCTYAFHLAATSYRETLLSVIRVYKISKANEKIESLLELAKLLPFTKTPEEAEILTRLAKA